MNKIPENVQYKVWKKTNGRCAYCGCQMIMREAPCASEFVKLQFSIDHALPQFYDGKDDIENLLPACRGCNSTKRHKTIEQYREYLEWIDIGKFSAKQIRWLNHHGIELPKPARHDFYFETIGSG